VQRIGKSAYASKVFGQAFGEWKKKPKPHYVVSILEAVKD